jgi:formylglycine-generating enzyme required for sulfatase activity
MRACSLGIAALACLLAAPALAGTVDYVMVPVGNPGNAADPRSGLGAVSYSFQIMKFEITNDQYTSFLNAVAGTDSYSLYNPSMGSDARGGITQSGSSGSYAYAVKSNMGGKPVNYVSWFDAVRMANWLQNGQGGGSTETGAYTLVGGQTSGAPPARNPSVQFWMPDVNERYKAAYYKGGSNNAGYWSYPTQNDTAPTAITADAIGIGSASSTGNFANFLLEADWNGMDGNVTTVGTNGGPSAYGAYDMGGNVWEWTDGDFYTSRGRRGGGWMSSDLGLNWEGGNEQSTSFEQPDFGFRLAGPAGSPVPEIDPSSFGSAFALLIGSLGWMERRARRVIGLVTAT